MSNLKMGSFFRSSSEEERRSTTTNSTTTTKEDKRLHGLKSEALGELEQILAEKEKKEEEQGRWRTRRSIVVKDAPETLKIQFVWRSNRGGGTDRLMVRSCLY